MRVLQQISSDSCQYRANMVGAATGLRKDNEEEGLMMVDMHRKSTDLEEGCLRLQQEEFDGDLAAKPLLPQNPSPKYAEPFKQEEERLVSLDVFRGLAVLAMILVDYGGGAWSAINHSPWSGITFADFVVPAFLFIVGVSLSLTHKATEDRRKASRKIVLRAIKIFAFGLILQGGYIHHVKDLSYGVDLQILRIMGVLQRIAIAYVIVAIFEVFLSNRHMADAKGSLLAYCWHWIAAFLLASLYVGLLYGLYVPDWHFELLAYTGIAPKSHPSELLVKCNVRGSMSPGCNAVGYLDRSIMGISHLYKRPPYRRLEECKVKSPYQGSLTANVPAWCFASFDPEGLLGTIPAIVTCFIGAHFGHVLLHVKGHKQQLLHWTASGIVMLLVGLLLEVAGMPLNKQLYTLSYTFVTGGAVGLAFSATFVLVDIYKWRSSTAIFRWVGARALIVYALLACDVLPILLQGLYWKSPSNNMIQILLRSLGS